MARELPRTLRSLSPAMQRGVDANDYEVIVVDNGSASPADPAQCTRWGTPLQMLAIDAASASVSPVHAVNLGIAHARGDLVGVMIDGARLASPGLVASALRAARIDERAVIVTLGFHLGPKVQMESIHEGYDRAAEDRLLEEARWHEDGYRLFALAAFAGSSRRGWFKPVAESNALFMRGALWQELGGFDARFTSPGGGYVNLDTLARAVQLPHCVVVTLLGEGTFHQVHGGVATNALVSPDDLFCDEYRRVRGRPYQSPEYRSLYFGAVPDVLLASIADSARTAAALTTAPAAEGSATEPANRERSPTTAPR